MGQGLVVWYGLSSFLLGLLLFWPLRKMMLSLSLSRYRQKTQGDIGEEALGKLQQRVSLIAAIVAMTFAFLYNRFVMLRYFG